MKSCENWNASSCDEVKSKLKAKDDAMNEFQP